MLKHITRPILFNALALWLTAQLLPGVTYQHNLLVLVYAALAFTLVNIFLKPLLKILLLPINIITLGMFRWVIGILILYLVVLFVPGFQIQGYYFSGLSLAGIAFPPMAFSSLMVYFLTAFCLSLFTLLLSLVV